jgi:hypothetical protein
VLLFVSVPAPEPNSNNKGYGWTFESERLFQVHSICMREMITIGGNRAVCRDDGNKNTSSEYCLELSTHFGCRLILMP